MNNRGFTLVELLATLVILGIVISLTVVGVNFNLQKAKNKTEDVFVSTIEDAMDIYIDSDAHDLSFGGSVCVISKTHGNVKLYKANNITFESVINSSYHPIDEADLVNPANENVKCNSSSKINVSIYRDDDYIYYYKINKSDFGCLNDEDETEYITNLPSGCLDK